MTIQNLTYFLLKGLGMACRRYASVNIVAYLFKSRCYYALNPSDNPSYKKIPSAFTLIHRIPLI